jgi:streptogramin lyase
LDFNPTTVAFSLISISITHDRKYTGGLLASDGHIYFVSCNAVSIGDFDPVSGVFTVIDISVIVQHSKYVGGVLAPDGHIYLVPHNADNILQLRHRRLERSNWLSGSSQGAA